MRGRRCVQMAIYLHPLMTTAMLLVHWWLSAATRNLFGQLEQLATPRRLATALRILSQPRWVARSPSVCLIVKNTRLDTAIYGTHGGRTSKPAWSRDIAGKGMEIHISQRSATTGFTLCGKFCEYLLWSTLRCLKRVSLVWDGWPSV